MQAKEFYEEFSADYDLMVSWEERLRREEPFFRSLFTKHGAKRVLDVACGSGMHPVAFARWGLEAAGADISQAMIELAEEHARAEGVRVRWAVAPFGSVADAFPDDVGGFDAVTCLGNSLPHILDDAGLAAALADMALMLRPAGTLVVQNRNYDRLLRDRQRFMPIASRRTAGGETFFIRITDFLGGERLSFTILVARRANDAWSCSARSTELRAIRREVLARALEQAGLRETRCYGGLDSAPFDAPGTADLVAIAVKPGG